MSPSRIIHLIPAGHDVAPRPVTTVAVPSYQASYGSLVPVDTTIAPITITLPPSDRIGEISIRYADGGNPITITPHAGDTIDGQASTTMELLGESRVFTSDGEGGWLTVASAPSPVEIQSMVVTVVTPLLAGFQPMPMVMNTNASVSGTYTIPDINVAQGHDLTLVGDTTFVFPVDPKGKQFRIVLRQDAAGGHVVTWPANARKPLGAFNLTTAPLATDSIVCFAVRPTHWGIVLEGKNYA